MPKCGYVVHKTMPLALLQQMKMAQSLQDNTVSNTSSSPLPKISTHYKRLIPPLRMSFWYIRAWVYLKQKLSKSPSK